MSNPIPGDDAERAAFEAFGSVRGYVRMPSGYDYDYVDSITQAQWEGFKLSRAAPVTADVAADIPGWRERKSQHGAAGLSVQHDMYYAQCEIGDLRARLARRAAGAPAETAKADNYEAAKRAYIKLTNSAVPTDSGGAEYIATQEIMRAFDGLFASPQIDATTAMDEAGASGQVIAEIALGKALLELFTYNPKKAKAISEEFIATNAGILPATAPDVAKDAARLEFLIKESCRVEILTLKSGTKYRLEWPDLDEAQAEWFDTPRAAIDSQIAAMGALPPTGSEKA